jgi:aryl-alcohol dehydrogenase-like predicted oxidoreductase
MKYRQLGKHGPKVSSLGLGCMGMSPHYGPSGDEATSLRVLQKAYEEGVNFFDTADMYGKGENEKIVGKGIKAFRKSIILSTKCALEYTANGLRINNTAEYIQGACNGSLKRLGVDHIDLYYLHRHDATLPIEEPMEVMRKLILEGKISYVGLSEVGPEIIERAYAVLGDKLVALQSEYSMMNRTAAEMILPTCRKLGLSFIAFSPLTRGLLSGKITDRTAIDEAGDSDFRGVLPQFEQEALVNNLYLVKAIHEFAKGKKATASQIALAWLLAQGEDVIPIPGTKKMDYLKENIDAVDITLSQRDLEELGMLIKQHTIKGIRIPEAVADFNWNARVI